MKQGTKLPVSRKKDTLRDEKNTWKHKCEQLEHERDTLKQALKELHEFAIGGNYYINSPLEAYVIDALLTPKG